MKKMIFTTFLILLILFINFNTTAKSSKEILFDDMTTENFIAKSGYLPFNSIKKICSFDFCDYSRGENAFETLEIFTRNYLKTINDEEVKSALKVKGIKITKIILK